MRLASGVRQCPPSQVYRSKACGAWQRASWPRVMEALRRAKSVRDLQIYFQGES
ncbi:hypothetical protein BYT27DRAFT_7179812, partial [Phlegmacium glaucopus]